MLALVIGVSFFIVAVTLAVLVLLDLARFLNHCVLQGLLIAVSLPALARECIDAGVSPEVDKWDCDKIYNRQEGGPLALKSEQGCHLSAMFHRFSEHEC